MIERLMPGSRVAVLRLLLGDQGEDLYLREIARCARVHLRAAQRELTMLESIGLVARRQRGRQVFFRVVAEHPLYAGLRLLFAGAPGREPRLPAPKPPPIDRSPRPSRDTAWRVW